MRTLLTSAVRTRAAAGGLAAFLAGCASGPPSAPPSVRDGAATPRAEEGRTPPAWRSEAGGVAGPASEPSAPSAPSAHGRAPAPSAVSAPRPARPAAADPRAAEPRSAGLREPGPRAVPPRPGESTPEPRAAREEVAAVAALIETAREAEEARRYGRAAALLERALRVDPRDPRLWARLASVRHGQGRHAEAEALALRSLSLRSGDRGLDAGSWRIVAAARRARGDEEGAREALRRAGSP